MWLKLLDEGLSWSVPGLVERSGRPHDKLVSIVNHLLENCLASLVWNLGRLLAWWTTWLAEESLGWSQ